MASDGERARSGKYKFGIAKSYHYVRRFQKQKAHDKIDVASIKETLEQDFLKIGGLGGTKPISVGLRIPVKRIVLLSILFLALFLVIIGYVTYTALTAAPKRPQTPEQYPPPESTYAIVSSGVLSYESVGRYITYLTLRLEASNTKWMNVSIGMYERGIPTQIFLLRTYGEETSNYFQFKEALGYELNRQGLYLHGEIDDNFLKKMPSGSKAIIIVPSGRIPGYFLGLGTREAYNFTDFMQLLRSGCVMIYMGKDFRIALSEDGSQFVVDQKVLEEAGIIFKPPTGSGSAGGFSLARPLYSIGARNGTLVNAYGSVYSVDLGTPGSFVFLPQTLDGGWKNGSVAAQDVARIIKDVAWQKPYTSGALGVWGQEGAVNNEYTIYTRQAHFGVQNGFGKLYIETTGQDGSSYARTRYIEVKADNIGDLANPPSASNGTLITIYGFLKPNFKEGRVVQLFHDVFRNTQRVRSDKFAEGRIVIRDVYEFTHKYEINLPEGEYMLRIVDNNGYAYAQSYLRVPGIGVSVLSPPHIPAFWMQLTADGQPVQFMEVRASIDGLGEQGLTTDEFGRFYYAPKSVSPGSHTITVYAAGKARTITVFYKPVKQWFEQPLNQALVVITILIFFVGMFLLRRPEKVIYSIDIPDFMPLEKRFTPVSKAVVTDLFSRINSEYKWSFMPLTLEEIKNGFRKITYQGKPVLIGDHNLEKILGALIEEKSVRRVLGLYGLARWEKDAGRSLAYLAAFRLLRNAFINNGVYFTDLNKADECDTVITLNRASVYVHIYENWGVLKKVLRTLKKGRSILVFAGPDALREFRRKLGRSTAEGAIVLKLHAKSGNLVLTTVEDVERLFKV
ncbi:MAG: hypothetical protein AB1468_02095 [Candidatus Micrarchaeota archaeon]